MEESTRNQLPSGHDEEFVTEVEDDFQCLICHLTLKEPILTRCGHRFCKECLEEHSRRQVVQDQLYTSCPADREVLDRDRDVFPDKATERKILSLTIKCPSEGCDWTGELRNKEVHLVSCPFKVVSCTNENCQVSLKRIDLEQHVRSTCEWRIIECEYCRGPLPECNMQDHIGTCSKFPLPCPNSCGDLIPREMIEHHDENDCPLSPVSCPYVRLGCNDKVQRKNVKTHLQTALREHLDFACVMLDNTLVQLNETQAQLNNTQIQLNNIQATTRNLQKQLEALERREKKGYQERESENTPFIWKINGFSEVFKNAKAKVQTKISSAPFYTERYGYKLKLTIHPNGSGKGKNTHLSAFIVVMKGEYDAILPWPFNRVVTLTLFDQQEDPFEKKDFVFCFTPKADEYLNFRRPVEEENPGRGKAQFISHEKLQTRRYIVDDTLFLQVDIGPR